MASEKRLIDAVRYREVLDRYINAPHVKMGCSYSGGMGTAIATCISFLDNQPTVDAVEVVHGRWEAYCGGLLKCTACGYEYTDYLECEDYCGNCGAKMDGERKDGE